MSEIRKNLGGVTAYAYAKTKGYTGTEEEFAQLMANYATVGETATEAAEQATTKAGEASTSATNAATSASAASASATAAAGSAFAAATSETNAAASATSASGSATQAATSATAAQAAQAAAEEVAESIPEDYSELSADVDDLKSALNDSLNLSNFEFVWGNVYNGSINIDKTRIHSVEMIWLPKGTKIKTSGSFANFAVAKYNLDGSYAANGTWTLEYVAQEDCYCRIVMRKPSGEIAENEIPGLVETLSIFYSTAAETKLFKVSSENTSKTELTEILRSEYGLLDLKDTDNVVIANLFDKTDSDVTTNGYYDRTNSFVSSSTLGTSGYIRVFQGYEYYTNLSAGFFVLWYDANKSFLTFSNVSGANVKFSVPLKAVYMRCLFTVANINTYTIKCDLISSIKAAGSPYANKNGVAFGTSLTYRAQTTGGYLQYLPAMCGANIENKGLGNSTILDNGSNPKMLDVITGYSGYSSKDFVILEGFVNDWYNNASLLGTWKDTGTTTVCGCVRTAIQHILTQNPSITLILIIDPIGKSASGVDCSSLAVRNGLTQTEFYDEIVKVANNLGIPTIRVDRLSGMSELTPYMYIDNIHPNEEGAKQTANTIWSVMKNIPLKVIDE